MLGEGLQGHSANCARWPALARPPLRVSVSCEGGLYVMMSRFRSSASSAVATVTEPSTQVCDGELAPGSVDSLAQGSHGLWCEFSNPVFELRPSGLDRIEVRTVGREKERLRPLRLDEGAKGSPAAYLLR